MPGPVTPTRTPRSERLKGTPVPLVQLGKNGKPEPYRLKLGTPEPEEEAELSEEQTPSMRRSQRVPIPTAKREEVSAKEQPQPAASAKKQRGPAASAKKKTSASSASSSKRRTTPPVQVPESDGEVESESEGDQDDSEDAYSARGGDSDSDDADSDDASTACTSESEEEEERDELAALDTPSRKRRAGSALPRTPKRSRILDTQARNAPYPSLPARSLHADLPGPELQALTPHARARRLLHVGATPSHLPCRGDEYEEILGHVQDAVQHGVGGCVYVAGVPGTGKTATVREVVRALKSRSEAGEVKAFNFVEINGLKLHDASQAYSLLWSAVSGVAERACNPKVALRKLSSHFASGASRETTVVLMDELDQLVTSKQDVVYNFFNWPSMAGSRLIVLAVANTMDLPERTLNAKVASRLGLQRVPFEPYSSAQLQEIVRTRLGMLPPPPKRGEPVPELSAAQQAEADERAKAAEAIGCDGVMSVGAIEFAAKKVANVTGDARRMLDVCRKGVEHVEQLAVTAARARGLDAADAPAPRAVSTADMLAMYKTLTNLGPEAHIRSLSLHAKILLVSLLNVLRRTGLVEASLADVLANHTVLCAMHGIKRPAAEARGEQQTWNLDELAAPLASLCAMGLTMAIGTGAGTGRAGTLGRLMLASHDEKIRTAISEDQDERLRKML